ncbi:serine/threonine-protein kinase [Deinococcus aquiradiocola]|uniref:Serine/threonine protein kinase n=1 Tax=Deinococcus aquiradiocola TaxID=393059 RepID=A0A917PJV2_9DEIO|nr:serine/threonine-protein kinase [Deinococcus aquiradiocola]GGJ82220.1 serine/threonine protein kinase [Deinococcus aquiradiocola]
MPLAGTLVDGQYHLVRPLGRGASSVVYFAVGRDGLAYAVKLFPPELRSHAEREYRNGAGLQHPRLARVLKATVVQNHPSLVLDFARGQVMFSRYVHRPSLRLHPELGHRGFESVQAANERRAYLLTLAHLLDALAHLHGVGIVHRDVKPENVIVDGNGSARLVDFDLSGPVGERFESPVRIGTAAFMSPEALRGEPLGPESDLYGVGLLLHWGLYGDLPADDLPHGRLSDDPLDRLRIALLNHDRDARPANAQQVRQALLQLAALPLA